MSHRQTRTSFQSGRSTQLMLVSYLRNLVDALASDHPPEDVSLLLTNVLTELFNGHPLTTISKVLCDREGSQLCEQLLRRSECTASHLSILLNGVQEHNSSSDSLAKSMSESESESTQSQLQSQELHAPHILWDVMADVYGAHCIDAILEQLRRLVLESVATSPRDENLKPLIQLLHLLSTPPCEWQKVVTSKSGSHTARHLLALVSDVRLTTWIVHYPRLFTLTTQFLSRVCIDLTPSLADLIHHVTAAPFLQSLLSTLHLHTIPTPDTLTLPPPPPTTSSSSSSSLSSSLLKSLDPHNLYDILVQNILTPPSHAHDNSSASSGGENSTHSPYVVRLMKAPIASHVLEVIISTCSDALYMVLYRHYFRGQLASLCSHPVANFVVQRLIDSSRHISHLSLLFTELRNEVRGLLSEGRAGVVLKLIEVAARQPHSDPQTIRLQREMVKCLVSAFVTDERDASQVRRDIAPILLHFTNTPLHSFRKKKKKKTKSPPSSQQQTTDTLDLYASNTHTNQNTQPLSFIGSQILSALFHYDATHGGFTAQSFLRMPLEEHLHVCMDPHGSHVVEQFLRSVHITSQMKLHYITLLKGHYAQLAKDKFGSHCVDRCYAAAELSKKELIVSELAEAEHDIAQSFHGRFVLKNCRVSQYKKKQEEWRQKEEMNVRALQGFQELFQEIVGSNNDDPLAKNSEQKNIDNHQTADNRKRKFSSVEVETDQDQDQDTDNKTLKKAHHSIEEKENELVVQISKKENALSTTTSTNNNENRSSVDTSLSKVIAAIQNTKPKRKRKLKKQLKQ